MRRENLKYKNSHTSVHSNKFAVAEGETAQHLGTWKQIKKNMACLSAIEMKLWYTCIMADFEVIPLVEEAKHRGSQLCEFANMKTTDKKEAGSCLEPGKVGASGERTLGRIAFLSEN